MYVTDNIDPAFRFEDLERFTFDNCKKYGDPMELFSTGSLYKLYVTNWFKNA